MRIIQLLLRIIHFLAVTLLVSSCSEKITEDPCLKTKWPQSKEVEIKLAVHVTSTNPNLPGGSAGSLNPVDFKKMVVSGSIEKVDCSELRSGTCSLGNNYITNGIDQAASIDISSAYWIGHVVNVYEFGNDKDYLDINLKVIVTMKDNQSYSCILSEEIHYPQVLQVPQEMYYYILIDIYSANWVKV